jgi:GT2 family glycosyltransferase
MSLFTFVILHYCSIKDTYDCVDSILKRVDTDNYNIIIVDNGSPNATGKQLQNTYKNNSKITVLITQENLGFAKGNNIGFIYAKVYFNPDFIILLNSDTLLIQDNFCKCIMEEYSQSHFAALGPQIHSPHGISSQNPGKSFIVKGFELWKMIIQTAFKLFLTKLYFDFIIDFIRCIKHKIQESRPGSDKTGTRADDVILHGCCLIFSRKFIDLFDGLDPRTFMYMEEEILYLHIKTNGLLSVYTPNITIYHLDDASINYVYSKPHNKNLFLYANSLKSLFVYLRILKEKGL